METKQLKLSDVLRSDDVFTLESLLTQNPELIEEVLRCIGIFCREKVIIFLCLTYPNKMMDQVCLGNIFRQHSLLRNYADDYDDWCFIELVLTKLEPFMGAYFEQNPTKKEIMIKNLNECVWRICHKDYPYQSKIEEVDTGRIRTIDVLVKFGAAPNELIDEILDTFAQRSTQFISFMSTNIDYSTCKLNNLTIFQLIIQALDYKCYASACESLIYLMENHHFDPSQCKYKHGNVLHQIQRLDVLLLILPILAEKNCLMEYLWQPDKRGMTPVDIHLSCPEFLEAFQKYDETVGTYAGKKNRKRASTIEAGCKLYYSEKHANKNDILFGYTSTVLQFTSPNGVVVLCTWKSFPDEDGSEYPFQDKKLVAVLEEGWTCTGTQCIGNHFSRRCNTFIPIAPKAQNSCTPCWNRMRNFWG